MRTLLPASLLAATLIACASNDPARPEGTSDDTTSATVAKTPGEGTPPGTGMTTSFRDSAAYATLLKADFFEAPWVGRSMEPSRNAIAFEELVSRPDAQEAMEELFNAEHAPQVRLYGLCGMYFTDPTAFRDGCERMSRLRVTVDYLKGDLLLSGQALSTLIAAPEEEPVLTFTSPERAVSQWKSRVAEMSGGYVMDIRHGGLPTGLRVAGRGGKP